MTASGETDERMQVLAAARTALDAYYSVDQDDDGSLGFLHNEVPCAVQAMELADGLTMLSLTCVVAWDLPDDPALAVSAAERAGQGLFGTLGVVHTDRGMDVTLRYAFPAQGLTQAPLRTLLMLVASTAEQLRADLLSSVNAS